MAELGARSIYRARERWPGIWATTRGSRRWKKALAHVNSWLTAWQPPRRRWDGPRESRRRGRKAKPRGAQPGGGVHRRVYRLSRKEEERATGSHRSDLQLTVGEDLLPCVLICPSRAQVGPATARITAESVVGGGFAGDLICFSCTLYHGEHLIRAACQPNLEHHFLLISNVNTSQALQQKCRAILHLQLCNMMMPQKPIGSCLNLSLKLMASIC